MSQVELDQKAVTDVFTKALADLPFFCKYFLEDWFPGPIPPVHRGMMAVVKRQCAFLEDDPDLDWIIANFVYYAPEDTDKANPLPIFVWDEAEGGDRSLGMVLGSNTLMLIPRGFAKTTIINAMTMHDMLYKDVIFPLYISKTAKHSTKQLKSITAQLQNPRILAVFGQLKPTQRKGETLTWSESDGLIMTTTGRIVVAIGAGGQARGQLVNGQRPQKINLDDLQDRESVKSDDRRRDLDDWFASDVEPCIAELDPNSSITMAANLTHADCLAMTLSLDPDWTVLHFGAIDKDGAPLWPALMDLDKIESKKAKYARRGKLHIFYMEYFNIVRAPEDASFKPSCIHIAPRSIDEFPYRTLALDPAISEKAGADFVSYSVVGMQDGGLIQVFENYSKRGMKVREQVDKFFELHKQYTPFRCGIENNAYQEALVQLVREAMFRKKHYFEVESITHTSSQKKHDRVEGVLQYRYSNGYVHHQRHFPELETQLMDWPNGKKDAPDSLAMAIKLLDDFAGVAGSDDPEEDEYKPLDEVMGGNWRKW